MNMAQEIVKLSANIPGEAAAHIDWRFVCVGLGGNMSDESHCDFTDGSIIYFMGECGLPVESLLSKRRCTLPKEHHIRGMGFVS